MKEIEALLKKERYCNEYHEKGKLKSFSIIATFQEISILLNRSDENNFHDPPCQTDLNDEKVEGMIDAYKINKGFFVITGSICIGIISFNNTYYLLDGQHRANAINRIYKETNDNYKVSIAFQYLEDDNESRIIFEQLNKDSYKNKVYVSLPAFEKEKHEKLKAKLHDNYKNCYALKKSEKGYLYTPQEFIDEITKEEFFDYHKDDSIDEIIKYIDNEHKKFFNHIGYLESIDKGLYYDTEKECIKRNTVIFFKNNNFIDYLCTKDIIPFHDFRNKRIQLTDKERKNIWKEEFKNQTEGICPIYGCKSKLNLNKKWGFECGHIKSVKNGGDNSISNIRPICANCNSKMSDENWDEYNKKEKRSIIWDEEFSDDEGECVECEKNITKDDFEYMEYKNHKTGKIKYDILCKKCSKGEKERKKKNDRKKYESSNV
jgi:hypothetical protein